MTPTRPACVVLLLATLAALAPGLDVEMRPTTIEGWFFHPEVGMMYVPLPMPRNLEMLHTTEVSGTCTATVRFNRAGTVDTLHPSRHHPEVVGKAWPGPATAKLIWLGSEWPQNDLRAEVVLSAMHYDSLGITRPEEPVAAGPHRKTLAPLRRVLVRQTALIDDLAPNPVTPESPAPPRDRGGRSEYGPPMVMEIVRVRAYTATQRDCPARVIPPDFSAEFDQGLDPSLWCIPRVCVVRMPTIAVSQEQAAAAGFVGEKRMGVRVRFGPSDRADHVELYWPSGSAPIDSLLARAARKATLRKNPGVSFTTQPVVDMQYRATVLRPFLYDLPAVRCWLEPEALQLVTTE